MPAYSPGLIRRRIREVMEGASVPPRTVPFDAFAYGVFDGQPTAAQKAKARNQRVSRHRFNVKIVGLKDSDATGVSVMSNRRIAFAPIEIRIWTGTKTSVQEDERDVILEQLGLDCDLAIQALSFPNALATTSDGLETGIISGILLSPDGLHEPEWSVENEDWVGQIITSRILGRVEISIQQAVA